MKKKCAGLALLLALGAPAVAQEPEPTQVEKLEQQVKDLDRRTKLLEKFKVSGYIQAQWQHAQPHAALVTNMKVGDSFNENLYDGGGYSRIGVRRGRFKLTYEEGLASAVLQLDATERGIAFKDIFINIKDPWWQTCAVRAGVFDRTFGYEISYSSSRRESPERATVVQLLFPEERDLGAALYLQAPAASPLSFLRLDAGLFSGNGVKPELDSRLDFIGHLYATGSLGANMKYGLGVSYYNGGVLQETKNVYKMEGSAFVLSSDSAANFRKYAKREYLGFDGQLDIVTAAGMTKLHAEYLFGQQPGIKASSKSPNAGILADAIKKMNPVLSSSDTYIRNFSGGYVMLTQDVGKLPFTAVLKYDWYDPNTRVSGNGVGKNGTGIADLAQSTVGFGALWRAGKSIRLTAYYEINTYEDSDATQQYTYNSETKEFSVNDLKRNVFTLRLQYKF